MSNSLEFPCWSVSVIAVAWMLAAHPELFGGMVVSTERYLKRLVSAWCWAVGFIFALID
ncbi:MAG: hypothetical protein CM1200mP41_29180 [Gammaproteobacteria bacterium]|nr:MAG: hypothetical protein CM1200mP41_29180 [Gammaproteobacteria bacterium]